MSQAEQQQATEATCRAHAASLSSSYMRRRGGEASDSCYAVRRSSLRLRAMVRMRCRSHVMLR